MTTPPTDDLSDAVHEGKGSYITFPQEVMQVLSCARYEMVYGPTEHYATTMSMVDNLRHKINKEHDVEIPKLKGR